jgi:cytochrome c
MKKLILPMLLAGMLTIVSCKKDGSEESFGKPETTTEGQPPKDLGAEIFAGKGACVACHKPDVKLVGPSL